MKAAGTPEIEVEPELDASFTRRLELALPEADQRRRRRVVRHRLTRLALALVLIAPLAAWRLMLTTPDGVHVAINALAWLTFILDVGVHVDTSVLSYLGLQVLPSVVGGLLLVMIAVWLLFAPREQP